jgi:hypothetical protein
MSRQQQQPCKAWASPGRRFCRHHGGRAVDGAALSPAERAERRKAKQARNLMRLQRWHERLERKRLGLLPSATGFRPEPQAAPSLEEQFRERRGPPAKLYDPTK